MYDIKNTRLFLLDMDGTFYLGETLLPGALEFLALCRETGRQFAFLTNNSSRSKADYVARLRGFGAQVTERDDAFVFGRARFSQRNSPDRHAEP